MIGAGSVVFSRNLTGDILSCPELRNATIAYMDVDRQRLDVAAALGHKTARALGAEPTIQATTDPRAALDGADFVINMVQVGGFDATLVDFEIPRKYGLNFTIADTTGPGGIFRALRTYPMLRALLAEMERVCPRARLLNYANPLSMNLQTIARTSPVDAVGLCHSVQCTLDEIMACIGVDSSRVAFTCAGINHMAFYLRLEQDGQDLYPRLFEAMGRPEVYNANKVRFELMKRLGYFVTESSEHSAEYCPYFLAHGREVAGRYSVPVDEYLRRCDGYVETFERMRQLAAGDEPVEVRRSREYGSTIIHAMVTGRPAVVYGNRVNHGAIANLPSSAIVEVPTLVDRSGLRLATVGELPPQLVGYVQPHVTQHELFIRAALEGRRDHVYQACMFDPLTSARLTLDQIVEMCDELIAAHGFVDEGGALPRLEAKRSLPPASGKMFGRADPAALRAARLAAQERAVQHYIREWQIVGPFFGPEPGKISVEWPTAVEEALARRTEGRIDLGPGVLSAGGHLHWRAVSASPKNGFVDLAAHLGAHEFCAAFAYAEVLSEAAREALLVCGSDDGIRIWLNGQVIHSQEVRRGYIPGNDAVRVRLVAGVNRLLVKVTNERFGWGFGVGVEDVG